MKKLATLLLAIVMVISLCACGMSKAAQAANNAISAIGEVTLDSGDAIVQAETQISKLTEDELKSVKNSADLIEARDTYDTLVNDGLSQFRKLITALTTAIEAKDIAQSLTLISSLRAELETLSPVLYNIAISMSLDDSGSKLPEALNQWETALSELCVNNTTLAQPGYVVTFASKGSWLVNDHGDLAAYNWWGVNTSELTKAYEQYKAYVSQYAQIIDNGTSFTFEDNKGNTITVCTSTTADNAILQVRVPRF